MLKTHPRNKYSSLSNYSLLTVVLLNHLQHALLKVLRVWPSKDKWSKMSPKPKFKTRLSLQDGSSLCHSTYSTYKALILRLQQVFLNLIYRPHRFPDSSWVGEMSRGGGTKIRPRTRGGTKHGYFFPISSAGREHSRSMSLQFNYHFYSSLTPPFSLFHHQQEWRFDTRAESTKVFCSGNYVTKLNFSRSSIGGP